MPKPNLKAKKTENKPPKMVIEPNLVPKKTVKKDDFKGSKPKFLIVCEGPTEAAYFSVLKEKYSLNADILPIQKQEKGHKSDLLGLLITAMKDRKKYDYIWIVTDNDEGNGYKLNPTSLGKIKQNCSVEIYEEIKPFAKYEMDIRADETEEEKMRFRYFLNRQAYIDFLQHTVGFSDTETIDKIIAQTEYKDDFTKLYSSDPKALFYDKNAVFRTTNNRVESDFDPNWKNYIRIAYSCISFETWLLLHFEICTTAFYNSREIIHYFDEKGYFMDKKANTKFEKGWYLYENRDENVLKDFFNKIDKAIENNIRLSVLQTQDTPFYEINPYSDVFKLTAQLTAITICYENQKLAKWTDFENIYLERQINEQTLLYLTYKGKATLMIDGEINLAAENGEITLLSDNIVRTNDTINLQIVGQQLLFYKISYKNQALCGTIK